MQEKRRFHEPSDGGQRIRGSEDQGFYGGGDGGQKLRGGGIDGT